MKLTNILAASCIFTLSMINVKKYIYTQSVKSVKNFKFQACRGGMVNLYCHALSFDSTKVFQNGFETPRRRIKKIDLWLNIMPANCHNSDTTHGPFEINFGEYVYCLIISFPLEEMMCTEHALIFFLFNFHFPQVNPFVLVSAVTVCMLVRDSVAFLCSPKHSVCLLPSWQALLGERASDKHLIPCSSPQQLPTQSGERMTTEGTFPPTSQPDSFSGFL